MKNSLRFLFIIAIFVFLGAAFYAITSFSQPQVKKNASLSIAASIYPLAFFAEEIGGDKIEVTTITPSGIEPHEYDPTTQDIGTIQQSDILLLNGGVESWGDKIITNLQGTQVTTLVIGDGLLTENWEEDGEIQKDPHIWLDPNLAKKEVAKITQAIIAKDADNTPYYQQNAKQLESRLNDLDAKYRNGLANCQKKEIITSHAAFGYLAKAYGLKQVAIAGLSTEVEPSAQQLTEVAKFAQQNGIKYIFFESLVSPKLSETLAQEVGAKTLVLDPIEGIPQDERAQGENYFTVMENNLKNLQIALECTQ